MAEPFTLDTSGSVMRREMRGTVHYSWAMLNPFTQGYAWAAFENTPPDHLEIHGSEDTYRQAGFSDLAPETLGAMVEDCASIQATHGTGTDEVLRDLGASTWRARQRGVSTTFPPLTLYLGDDGLVRTREAS